MLLFERLVKKANTLKYLLTYKLSQDHLELFFSAIRSRGGWNNNPSVVHFKAAWQRLLCHQQLKEVGTGNCVSQDSCRILSISSRIDRHQPLDITTLAANQSNASNDDDLQLPVLFDHDYVLDGIGDIHILSLYVENVVTYIAGFVVRSIKKRIDCDKCIDALCGMPEDLRVSRDDFALIDAKDNGGLVHPSDSVISLCKASESCFRSRMGPNDKPLLMSNLKGTLINDALSTFVGSSLIFSELNEHCLDSELLHDHCTALMRLVIDTYLTVRLHHQAKHFSRSLHPDNIRSKLSKTIIFKGQ